MLTHAANDWITEIALLTPAECAEVRAGIEDLRSEWIQRHPEEPFYTLGTSNYFDIAYNPVLPYYRMAARLNPVLKQRFGRLYDSVAESIAAHLCAPVGYREGLALPGFHIFLSSKAFETAKDLTHREWFRAKGKSDVMGNAIHCDTAHLVVDWGSREGIDFKNPISFTLPIVLPKSGAGLNYWDFGLERTDGLPEKDLRAFLLASEKRFHAYRAGVMAVHSGMRYHQMAVMRDLKPEDERITLQGHGLLCNGVWQLFW